MKKILLPAAISLIGLTSGCKDEKLKECMAKTEDLEQEFEEACNGDYSEITGLHYLVEKRDKIWKGDGCDQYQAKWVCKCDWGSEYGGSYYHYTEIEYGKK